MDLALVDVAFVDAEASRQQERVMVETGFVGTYDSFCYFMTAYPLLPMKVVISTANLLDDIEREDYIDKRYVN